MGKDVYLTIGNQRNHSTIEAPSNVVAVPDLNLNNREPDPRIALHTAFASSTDEPSAVCVVAIDTEAYISLLYVCQYCSGKL